MSKALPKSVELATPSAVEYPGASAATYVQGDYGPDPDASTAALLSALGVVVIGRNEGERLAGCLQSVAALSQNVVYVDSGSTDGSIELGRTMTADVVELDLNSPFTAARARNAGCKRLLELRPHLQYVFFVDGDCEVQPGFLAMAKAFLDENERVAVVWGHRRERYPNKSIYNMLCDFEWSDIPDGEHKICGGDALIRITAFNEVGGYHPKLICGEEPEMCVRLRKRGWKIWRLGAPMTLHDVAMFHFDQWWKRSLRAGYGFAQGAALHGASEDRHGVPESIRAWAWGFGVPLLAFLGTLVVGWWSLLILAVYPVQILRIAIRGKRTPRENWLRAAALVVSKFAEVYGQLKYLADRARGVRSGLIEYK